MIDLKNIEDCLSGDRLSVYGADGVSRQVMLARYCWNVALAESLYPVLHLLEVGLRNAIHQTMVEIVGTQSWFDVVEMTPWAYSKIGEAKQKLARRGRGVTPGRVIAELSFGFWGSMFEGHYLSKEAQYLPGGIKLTFPYLPKSEHRRKAIKARLDRIRRLRNRVFHHERIIHFKDLRDQHVVILETLAWIHPDLDMFTELVDRFEETHRLGIEPYLDMLEGAEGGRDGSGRGFEGGRA